MLRLSDIVIHEGVLCREEPMEFMESVYVPLSIVEQAEVSRALLVCHEMKRYLEEFQNDKEDRYI